MPKAIVAVAFVYVYVATESILQTLGAGISLQ